MIGTSESGHRKADLCGQGPCQPPRPRPPAPGHSRKPKCERASFAVSVWCVWKPVVSMWRLRSHPPPAQGTQLARAPGASRPPAGLEQGLWVLQRELPGEWHWRQWPCDQGAPVNTGSRGLRRCLAISPSAGAGGRTQTRHWASGASDPAERGRVRSLWADAQPRGPRLGHLWDGPWSPWCTRPGASCLVPGRGPSGRTLLVLRREGGLGGLSVRLPSPPEGVSAALLILPLPSGFYLTRTAGFSIEKNTLSSFFFTCHVFSSEMFFHMD